MSDQDRTREQDQNESRRNENVTHDDVQLDVVDDDVTELGLDNAVENSSVQRNDQ